MDGREEGNQRRLPGPFAPARLEPLPSPSSSHSHATDQWRRQGPASLLISDLSLETFLTFQSIPALISVNNSMSDSAPPPSQGATTTSQLGSAPQRKRHRDEHVQYAYKIQTEAALRGMLVWTIAGASTVFMAHHLFPLVRRQTLAGKAFLTSGFTIFGLCTGAEAVLQHHETQQRSEENIIRDRARLELGKRGMVASEAEIERWRVDEREKLIRRLTREREEGRKGRSIGEEAMEMAQAQALKGEEGQQQQPKEQQEKEAVQAVGQVETVA